MLDTKYVNVRSNILMMQPLPNVSMAYRLLIQDEKQRSIVVTGETHAMTFIAEDRKFDSKIAFYKPPSSWNKNSGNYRGGDNGTRRTFFCEHCKMNGNTIDRCYELHGHPSTFKEGKGKRLQPLSMEMKMMIQINMVMMKLFNSL